MSVLALAPRTAKAAEVFKEAPASVVILHGPAGSGKQRLAKQLIAEILGLVQEKLIIYPYYTVIEPEKNSISIDAVRELQSTLVRSVPGDRPFRRAILIQDAHKLTPEAQNALLKSLEEPPVDTLFVLTVDGLHQLLPTVVSRARALPVLPLDAAAAKKHFGDTPEAAKAYQMSAGRAELLEALMEDEDHPLTAAIAQAKEVLQKDTYERLVMVNALAKDRAAVDELLEALLLLARVSLQAAAAGQKTEQVRQWHKIRKQVLAAQKDLRGNAGSKLVLTDLFTHL